MHYDEHKERSHVPVLLQEVLTVLRPAVGESYLDMTAGYGGHAEAVLAKTKAPARAVLVDRDQQAIKELKQKFGRNGITITKSDFYTASYQLAEKGGQFDLILADLGVSSPHLNMASRGFSFQADGPLDMRMDASQELDAATIVNSFDENRLADLIRRYGEEPKAARIARLIVNSRPITGTKQLAGLVSKAWPGYYKIHPATRTFQALRIAVNDELTQLEISLPVWLDLLAPGGRLAIVSFHSLEDRIVKQFMQAHSGNRYDAELQLITKRPLTARSEELVFNPRARSAKLRAAAKINNKRKGHAHADSG